jgi:hypothetical protein
MANIPSKHDLARDVAPIGQDVRLKAASQFRFRSIRGYRRALERIMVEAAMGVRPMSDITAFAAGTKAASEMFLAEKMLAKQGLDCEVPDHPLGDAGGEDVMPPSSTYVKRKLVVKDGINKHGRAIQEQAVTVEGDNRAIAQEEALLEIQQEIDELW